MVLLPLQEQCLYTKGRSACLFALAPKRKEVPCSMVIGNEELIQVCSSQTLAHGNSKNEIPKKKARRGSKNERKYNGNKTNEFTDFEFCFDFFYTVMPINNYDRLLYNYFRSRNCTEALFQLNNIIEQKERFKDFIKLYQEN